MIQAPGVILLESFVTMARSDNDVTKISLGASPLLEISV
jgi:hypothetical protein